MVELMKRGRNFSSDCLFSEIRSWIISENGVGRLGFERERFVRPEVSLSWCSECGGRLGLGVSVGCGASSSLQRIKTVRQESGQRRPGPLLLPRPGAYIITTKMLRSRESRHPGPARPPAQPWCLEDALCGFMSLASPTGSCLRHGIPWPSTPPSQSHEENIMYFPMSPATPVPRTVTAE